MQFPPRSVSPFRNMGSPALGGQVTSSPIMNSPQIIGGPRMGPTSVMPPMISGGMNRIPSGRQAPFMGNVVRDPRSISPIAMRPGNNIMSPFMPSRLNQGPSIGYPLAIGDMSPLGAVPIGAPQSFPLGLQRPQPQYIGYKILNQFPRQPIIEQPNQNYHIPYEEPQVYCVICQQSYPSNAKQEHLKRHLRPVSPNLMKKFNPNGDTKNGPQVRPIVQPEQYNIQYDPKQFVIEQQQIYSTPALQPTHDIGIGTTSGPMVPLTPVAPMAPPVVQPVIPPPPPQTIPSIPPPNPPFNPQGSGYNPQQSVRLTQDGENFSNYDPSMYQGGRIPRPSQVDPQPQPIQPPIDNSRFSRNTFISDQPAPAFTPDYMNNTNRQTLQNQDPRMTQYSASNYPNPQTNTGLPQRPTMISQNFDNNASFDPSRYNSQYNPPLNGSQANNIRGSQVSNTNQSNVIQNNLDNIYNQPPRQTNLPTQPSIIDDFDFNPSQVVQPRNTTNLSQMRNTEIPFDNIINEKIR